MAKHVEMIRLRIPRRLLEGFPQRLRAHALRESDTDARARLLGAVAKIEDWMRAPGDPIACEAPEDSWYWLSRQCQHFDTGGLAGALSDALGRWQHRDEIRARRAQRAAIGNEARAFRQRQE